MEKNPKQKSFGRQNEKGQLALEYVLILVACVALATLVRITIVDRSPDSPGFLIQRWVKLSQAIGEDTVDK